MTDFKFQWSRAFKLYYKVTFRFVIALCELSPLWPFWSREGSSHTLIAVFTHFVFGVASFRKFTILFDDLCGFQIPLSSANADLQDILERKKRLIVFNKMDLANPNMILVCPVEVTSIFKFIRLHYSLMSKPRDLGQLSMKAPDHTRVVPTLVTYMWVIAVNICRK